MMSLGKGLFCKINPRVVIEYFEDGALVLNLDNRVLIKLGQPAGNILSLIDGQNSPAEIASLFAEKYLVSELESFRVISNHCEELIARKIIVTQTEPTTKGNQPMDQSPVTSIRYMRNPDVVLREEDEEGGLLFNPDNNEIKVINNTGLFIWKQFDSPAEIQNVIQALSDAFEDVPQNDVQADVQVFLDEMLRAGFVGVVDND